MYLKDIAIARMREIFGSDIKRINHALKVLKFSEEILQGENISNEARDIIVLTAIFHDIGIHEAEKKYNSTSGKYQEIEGPPIASKILKEIGAGPDIIGRVCYIVGGHHTASKNDGIDFEIIWEADLIVNIEEDELDKKGIDLAQIIEKNFKTITGKTIAQRLYLR